MSPKFNGYGEEHPERNEELEAADHFHDKREDAADKVRGKGKGKFAKAMSEVDNAEQRDQVRRDLEKIAPKKVVDQSSGIEYDRGRITEPRCHVCQHPYRDWIETMLIRGQNYLSIQNRVPPLEGHKKLDRRSVSNHHKNHMDLQDAALRALLEREAEIQGQNFEDGVEDAITKRGVLEVALRKGYEDIINGTTTVEPRDLIQIAKVLADMDTHQHAIGLDELRAQVQIFIQAIKDVCDQDTQNAIAERVKELRTRENITKQIEGAMDQGTPPQMAGASSEFAEAEVVE